MTGLMGLLLQADNNQVGMFAEATGMHAMKRA